MYPQSNTHARAKHTNPQTQVHTQNTNIYTQIKSNGICMVQIHISTCSKFEVSHKTPIHTIRMMYGYVVCTCTAFC